jgi:hypothetical protein
MQSKPFTTEHITEVREWENERYMFCHVNFRGKCWGLREEGRQKRGERPSPACLLRLGYLLRVWDAFFCHGCYTMRKTYLQLSKLKLKQGSACRLQEDCWEYFGVGFHLETKTDGEIFPEL